jgi:hypothetical protein
MYPKPVPSMFGRIVIGSIASVLSTIHAAGQIKYAPSGIIEPSTDMAEGAACAVRPTNAAAG